MIYTVPTGQLTLSGVPPVEDMRVFADAASQLAVRSHQGTRQASVARMTLRSRLGHAILKHVREPRRQWKWVDPYTGEDWSMDINPNQQATPHPAKGTNIFVRNPSFGITDDQTYGQSRVWLQKKVPLEWELRGVLRSASEYQKLYRWRKPYTVHLHDDIGRRFDVKLIDVNFDEDYPAPGHIAYKTRYEYTAKLMLYGVRD